ncbi:MAG: PIN domain-containing protein [Pseudomonadota bacterium]
MRLVDSSIWIDHIRRKDAELTDWLLSEDVLTHPMVVGEVLMGSIANRALVARSMDELPSAVIASHQEVRALAEQYTLYGRGIGFVDAHLLASTRLTMGARLETRDRRLKALAVALGVG